MTTTAHRESRLLEPALSEDVSLSREDVGLRDRLVALEDDDPQWWDSGAESTVASPSSFVYPATMVPSIVGQLMDQVAEARGQKPVVLDPFAGSGTVVAEAVARGWDVTAIDINPLAALICRVVAGPYHHRAFCRYGVGVIEHARRYRRVGRHSFDGIDKWFEPDTSNGLARLRRAILNVPSASARRFLWVVLAETVRLTSNSRLSTVKLHIKPKAELRAYDAVSVFESVLAKAVQNCRDHAERCRLARVAVTGWPVSEIRVVLGDMRQSLERLNVSPTLVVTSPPYGDNQTTVAYGQNSWLPLQWIQLSDIDPAVDDETLAGPNSIDADSLGGRRSNAIKRAESVRSLSETADWIIDRLSTESRFAFTRVASFLADIEAGLTVVADKAAEGAHVVLVIGDRTVAGQRVPTAKVAQEVMAALGGETVWVANRNLPASRRMASRNSFATRMSNEWLMAIRLRPN